MVTSDAVAARADRRRSPRRTRSLVAGGGLIAAAAVLLGLGIGPADALGRLSPWGPPSPPTAAAPLGPEPSTCEAPAPATSPTTVATVAAPAAGASVAQTVTVVVPPIVRVLDDSRGALTVVTNAARPPAPGDQVWVRGADGDYEPADPGLTARVMAARWDDTSWCSTTAEHTSVTGDRAEASGR